MHYLHIFGLEVLKTSVIFEIIILEFVKLESLTYIMNFGIGCAFSNGLGSTFFEALGPDPGPLEKVCHFPFLILFSFN